MAFNPAQGSRAGLFNRIVEALVTRTKKYEGMEYFSLFFQRGCEYLGPYTLNIWGTEKKTANEM